VSSIRRCAAVLLASLAGVALAGCGDDAGVAAPVSTGSAPAAEPVDPPMVAVTTNILADVVAAISKGRVEVLDLMPRGADPHSFALSAAETARVLDADLVVANGLGLEEGLVEILGRAADGDVEILEVAPLLDPLPFAVEGAADPHVWTDPGRMVVAVEMLGARLAELVDDEAATDIAAASERYIAELVELDAEIEGAVASLPAERRRLVTNHHVLGYFADRYGFEIIGAVLPSGSTLASPSAADLAGLAQVIRDSGVPAIFAETSQPDRLIEVLADESGLDVTVESLYSESLGPAGGVAGSYLDMMRFNATTITAALAVDVTAVGR
jgi:zinc/manganese transport system substrate-binding protein